jgi:hypothetical protein
VWVAGGIHGAQQAQPLLLLLLRAGICLLVAQVHHSWQACLAHASLKGRLQLLIGQDHVAAQVQQRQLQALAGQRLLQVVHARACDLQEQ